MSERKYSELFEYLSAPETASSRTGAVVFGRKDPLVAEKLVTLSAEDRIKWAVITGGVGKDSAGLSIPEAEYLAQEAEKYAANRGVTLPPVLLETQATNGGENARNSLDVIRRAHLGHSVLTAVAHATSLRRLSHMLDHAAAQRDTPIDNIYRVPSDYHFDPDSPSDQAEAISEMKRLIEWPDKEWLLPGVKNDIPANLVDFVQDKTK